MGTRPTGSVSALLARGSAEGGQLVDLPTGPVPMLAWLQSTVGGYVEMFRPYAPDALPGWLGLCNEEGKLLGFPINWPATTLAREAGWSSTDVLAGPVVFVGAPETPDGNPIDVPAALIHLARDLIGWEL